MNEITRRGLLVSTAALTVGGLVRPAQAAMGSVYMRIDSAGFIIGASGGHGTLTFRGQSYPLSIGGVSAGLTIGVSVTELVGVAYHLHNASDIQGTYSQFGAGMSVAGGAQVARLSNSRGVTLQLRGKQVGFMFSVDLSGMSISLS
jgi:hypothetical protein